MVVRNILKFLSELRVRKRGSEMNAGEPVVKREGVGGRSPLRGMCEPREMYKAISIDFRI